MPRLYSPLDMNKREIRNAVFQTLGKPPEDPYPRQYYYDTSLRQLRYWTGKTWASFGGGKWENERQIQDGVESVIEHGLGTEAVVVSFTQKRDVADDPSTSGQEYVRDAVNLDWTVIDENKISVKSWGAGNNPNSTFLITIMG